MMNSHGKLQKSISIILLLSIFQITVSDDTWKWNSNGRSNENARSIDQRNPVVFKNQYDYVDGRPLPQYEVSESVEGISGRPLQKPPDFRPPVDFRPDYEGRPTNNYPSNYPGGYGQGNRPNYPPNGNGLPRPSFWGDEHPGAINENSGGVLTGPVPSWVREPAIKNYDRCKCSLKMNCNSPGISFGQCDVGKQYCCYNSQGNALGGTNPQPQHHSSDQGILIGPGGPTGNVGRPGQPRPVVDRPYANGHPGILVGPGGPTGTIGRPQNNRGRPEYENGILIGPGGPTGTIGRPQNNRGRPNEYGNGILIGPGGPTGQIGRPQNYARPENTRYPSDSNGILIGPGGPFDFPQRRYGTYQQVPYPRS